MIRNCSSEILSGYKRIWNSTGPFTNWKTSVGWRKRAAAGILKAVDLAFSPLCPAGTQLDALRNRLIPPPFELSAAQKLIVEKIQQNLSSNDSVGVYGKIEGRFLEQHANELIALINHPDINIQKVAVDILHHLCKFRKNKLLSERLFAQSINSLSKYQLSMLLADLLSGLKKGEYASLRALRSLGSVIHLPEEFFQKFARVMANPKEDRLFKNRAINFLPDIKIRKLTAKTMLAFSPILKGSDPYAKALVINCILLAQSKHRALPSEVISSMLSGTSRHLLSEELEGIEDVFACQSRFGLLPRKAEALIIKRLDLYIRDQDSGIKYMRACAALGQIAKSYREQGHLSELSRIKNITVDHFNNASQDARIKWGLALIEIGHSIKLDQAIVAGLERMEIGLKQALAHINQTNRWSCLLLNKLPANPAQDKKLMRSASDSERSIETISLAEYQKHFIIIKKGLGGFTPGVITSRVAEFNLHSHPDADFSISEPKDLDLNVLPSSLDLEYVSPLAFREYIWARERLWRAEPATEVKIKEGTILFVHSNGVRATADNDYLKREKILKQFLALGGPFHIFINYGSHFGTYKVTHQPGLSIRQAWERSF